MFNGFQNDISKLFFDFVIGLLKFLYFIEDSFYILAGSKIRILRLRFIA